MDPGCSNRYFPIPFALLGIPEDSFVVPVRATCLVASGQSQAYVEHGFPAEFLDSKCCEDQALGILQQVLFPTFPAPLAAGAIPLTKRWSLGAVEPC